MVLVLFGIYIFSHYLCICKINKMAESNTLGRNIILPIKNADGTSFHGLELNKFTFDTVVMSLGDKITGDVYYPTNQLVVQQTEYVEYDGVKYYLINLTTG
mgnify:CR=1 FL=1